MHIIKRQTCIWTCIKSTIKNEKQIGKYQKYKVNNKFIDKAANLKRVSAGDQVHWYFTTAGY